MSIERKGNERGNRRQGDWTMQQRKVFVGSIGKDGGREEAVTVFNCLSGKKGTTRKYER